jgi:hypothetical protein
MSVALNSMTRVCGTANPPGTKAVFRFWKKGELTTWPATVAAGGGTAAGDTKRLAGNFSFIPSGYMREVDVLVDSAQLKNMLEGEPGGQGYKTEVTFFVLGTQAEQLEFADCMAAFSGCLIGMLETRAGDKHVIGNIDIPCFITAAEMDSGAKNGDKSGTAYTLTASTGYTSFIYNGTLKTVPTPGGSIPSPSNAVKEVTK